MKKLRILLLPFSLIYGVVIALRNQFYDWGIFKSYSIPKKSICVGNLSVGGTGKTPHVDLIVEHFLLKNNEVSTLSRGYGRTTKGLKEVQLNSSAKEVGDEPLFYKNKYGDQLKVVVSEKRKLGVDYIVKTYPDNEIIILDDAFQHRAVKAGLNILITDYNNLFSDDYLLPAGNLREGRRGKKRADIIIVSKCPENISEQSKKEIHTKLGLASDKTFFSHIVYNELIPFNGTINTGIKNVLLVTGIGNPTPLADQLRKSYSVEHIQFRDHHQFSVKDIEEIHEKFDTFASQDKIIVTTEKDFMRLKDFKEVNSQLNRWYYQPITTQINQQPKFKLLLDEYVI